MSILAMHEVSGLVLLQDRGRFGYAHLGVPRAGALDPAAAALANRLVGNDEAEAVVELTMADVAVTVSEGRWFAVTGARCAVTVGGLPVACEQAVWARAGEEVRLGRPTAGARAYLAIGGGLAVDPVLGSRASDTLAGVGPPPLRPGSELPLGPAAGHPAPLDVPQPRRATGVLTIDPGPRVDWFADDALARLCATSYVVRPESNRVGLRLDGPALPRARAGELPSEGMVLGAVQVPPDGRPVVFLADHPTTGGYPVLAVVRSADLGQCAQLRPGAAVRFARGR